MPGRRKVLKRRSPVRPEWTSGRAAAATSAFRGAIQDAVTRARNCSPVNHRESGSWPTRPGRASICSSNDYGIWAEALDCHAGNGAPFAPAVVVPVVPCPGTAYVPIVWIGADAHHRWRALRLLHGCIPISGLVVPVTRPGGCELSSNPVTVARSSVGGRQACGGSCRVCAPDYDTIVVVTVDCEARDIARRPLACALRSKKRPGRAVIYSLTLRHCHRAGSLRPGWRLRRVRLRRSLGVAKANAAETRSANLRRRRG